MSKTTLATGMLAFARSIQLTEALMWARVAGTAPARLLPIEITEKGVRAQSSEDNSKNPGGSNIQTVDQAVVPAGCDALVISFSGRILSAVMAPHATDNAAVGRAFAGLAKSYHEAGGFRYLAERYLWNILNGRFAWRNRLQSDAATVTVRFNGRSLCVDALAIDLMTYDGLDEIKAALVGESTEADLEALITGFAEALGRDDKPFEFSVEWCSELPGGAEVWPSQEYIRSAVASSPLYKDRSRIYAAIPSYYGDRTIRQASIHSQKINAALRHIDDWHGVTEHGAIAVNPYGGVQGTGDVLRKEKKGVTSHFYAVMDGAAALEADMSLAPEDMSPNTHFFFANLIRGGVFGRESDKKKKEKEKAKADAEKAQADQAKADAGEVA